MIMLLLTAISAFIALAFPQAVFAIKVENPCPLSHILSCTDLPAAVVNIGNAAILSFGGFLIAMFVFYGINMLIATGDENAMTDARKSVAFAIFGAILVAGAGVISNSLTNSGNFGGNLIDANSISGPGGFLWKIIEFIMGLAGAALTVMITYQGFRLVLSSDESQSSAARKNFLEGLIGAAVLVLVVPLVEAFIPSGTDTPIRAMAEELSGIARFLATMLGGLAVIAIVAGGIMLVASVQDSMKEKGRQIIIASLVALIVVWSSYAIITIFIP